MDEKNDLEKYIDSFTIKFNKEPCCYYVGETVNGVVEVNLNCDTEIHDIQIRFQCQSYVCWYSRQPDGYTEYVKHCKSYWNQMFTIWGKILKDDSPVPVLHAGGHTYPFSVSIPDRNLPSSFESKFGAIRYWVTAYINHKDREANTSKTFTVLQRIDMNEKKYQSKVSNDAEKSNCCSCFRPSLLVLSATLDRTGYCPGESIAVNCRGKNCSVKDIGGIKARLVQKVIYNNKDRFKMQENIISAIGGNKIEKGHTKVWENQLLKIPCVPPTVSNCDNIAVLYHVQITMAVPKGVDLQFRLPITIGTVPLLNTTVPVKCALKLCTDGVSHFNQSCHTEDFPLEDFVPSTVHVENFLHIPKPSAFTQVPHKSRTKDDERQPLLLHRPNS